MADFVDNDVRDAVIAQLLTIPENKVSVEYFGHQRSLMSSERGRGRTGDLGTSHKDFCLHDIGDQSFSDCNKLLTILTRVFVFLLSVGMFRLQEQEPKMVLVQHWRVPLLPVHFTPQSFRSPHLLCQVSFTPP